MMLAVAGLNGIKDVNEVMPKWTHPKTGKGGMTRAGAQAVLLAAELRVLKGGALAALPMTMAEVEALAK
jgi:hypothetical protein